MHFATKISAQFRWNHDRVPLSHQKNIVALSLISAKRSLVNTSLNEIVLFGARQRLSVR